MQLRCGDGIEVTSDWVLSKSVDLVLTDPPYGTTKCKWDTPFDLKEWWAEIKRVRKDGAPVVVFCTQPFTTALIQSNIGEVKYCWVWDKTFGRGHLVAKYRPMQQTEDIAVFGEGRINYYPQMVERETPIFSKEGSRTKIMGGMQATSYEGTWLYDRHPTNILTFKPVHHSVAHHPTEKPLGLIEYLIRTYSKPGDVVLDTFMGGGTTGVGCVNEGREFIGIERDKDIFLTAHNRITKVVEEVVIEKGR